MEWERQKTQNFSFFFNYSIPADFLKILIKKLRCVRRCSIIIARPDCQQRAIWPYLFFFLVFFKKKIWNNKKNLTFHRTGCLWGVPLVRCASTILSSFFFCLVWFGFFLSARFGLGSFFFFVWEGALMNDMYELVHSSGMDWIASFKKKQLPSIGKDPTRDLVFIISCSLPLDSAHPHWSIDRFSRFFLFSKEKERRNREKNEVRLG